MRVVVLLILFTIHIYANTQENTESIDQTPLENSIPSEEDTQKNIQDQNKIAKINNFFNTAEVSNNSYSAFMVGYEMLNKSMNGKKSRMQGMYFELDRGFLLANDVLLLGASLDGTAGGFYSINLNAKFGVRIFNGRIIPSISFGYGLLNHSINDKQYNLHGAISTASLFIDIGSGFGLEAGYRAGLHTFKTTQKTDIKVKNIGAFMLNFKFIDFSI